MSLPNKKFITKPRSSSEESFSSSVEDVPGRRPIARPKSSSEESSSSSPEEIKSPRRKYGSFNEEPPITIKTKPNKKMYSSSESSPSSSGSEYLNEHLPNVLAEMVRSYAVFGGDRSSMIDEVYCVASHDKEKIYYLTYNEEEKDSYLIRLDLRNGETRRRKLNLEKYKLKPLGCSKKKNFLFISNVEKALLLDLKTNKVIYSGKFSMREKMENHLEIISLTKETISILSTVPYKRFGITVIDIKSGKLILTKNIGSRFPIKYVGTGPVGEIIFLINNTLVKYY